jgi:type I site-specific restriction-modification system R (restriction) subunit
MHESYATSLTVVRRVVLGNFTFVIMTDREDLDEQIYRTFAAAGSRTRQRRRGVLWIT